MPEYLKKINRSSVVQRVIDRLTQAMLDRKSTRLNSSHIEESRMPSSA